MSKIVTVKLPSDTLRRLADWMESHGITVTSVAVRTLLESAMSETTQIGAVAFREGYLGGLGEFIKVARTHIEKKTEVNE